MSKKVELFLLKTVLLKALLIVSYSAMAQQMPNFYFKHFTQKQNHILGQSINSIACDYTGFIWFGTDAGLYRFDGNEIKSYFQDQLNNKDLQGRQILYILAGKENCIWLGTSSGMFLFDYERYMLTPIPIIDGPDSTKRDFRYITRFIYEAFDGTIYVATTKYLYVVNKKKQCLNRVHFLQSDNLSNFSGVVKAKTNTLWLSTFGNGLFSIDLNSGKIQQYCKESSSAFRILSNTITSIIQDSQNDIWITTNTGLNRISPETGVIKEYIHSQSNRGSITSEPLNKLYEDNERNLWVGSEAGLYLFDRIHESFIKYVNDIDNDASLSADKIKSLVEDRQGNLWIFAFGNGINYANLTNAKAFETYFKKTNNPQSLSNNLVNTFLEDVSGNLWIGTDGGGLDYFDRKNNIVKHFKYEYNNSSALQSNAITSLYIDSFNDLWIGTYNGGLSKRNKDGTFTTYKVDDKKPGSISSNNIVSIIEDENRNLLVLTLGGGLNVLNRITSTFKCFRNIEGTTNSLCNNSGITLFRDSYGFIWIGTYNGLSIWNPKENKFSDFFANASDKNSLCSNWVFSIFEDSQKNIWIGTNNGLNVYNRATGKISVPGNLQKLSKKSILAIFEDADHSLWFNTKNDCYKYEPSKNKLSYFDFSAYLSGYINKNAFYKCKNGNVLIGTTKGFCIFKPSLYSESGISSHVLLTDLKISDKSVRAGDTIDNRVLLGKDISVTSQFSLLPDEKNFSLEFTNINFAASDKITYSFILKGYDKDWHFTTSENRHASYSNLPAGTYTFEVKALTNNSYTAEPVTQIRIQVTTYWWLTIWAYIGYVLMVISLMVVYFNISLARIRLKKDLFLEKMKNEKEIELNQLKTNFITNITHEFRTPLTLISAPVDILISKYQSNPLLQKHLLTIKRSADRLLLLINELLELRKYESSHMALQASKGNIIAFTDIVTQSFTSQANIHSIDFKIIHEADYVEVWFDPIKLEKVIYNLLSNAFKFTPDGGKVEIQTKIINGNDGLKGKYVQISVTDSGIGIPEEAVDKVFESFFSAGSEPSQSTGIGLALTKQIVVLHGGSIHVSSRQNHGACFSVNIPLGEDHFNPEQKFSMNIPEINAGVLPPNTYNKEIQSKSGLLRNVHKTEELPIILIVEDNNELREFLKMELDNNYKVIEANNGVKGLEMAFEFIPDLIISDVMMPEMNGIELCSKLKTDIKTNHIPVILLTARNAAEQKIEGLESGADSYISKPFHPKHLEVRIRKLIENRRKLKEKFKGELTNKSAINQEEALPLKPSADDVFVQKAIAIVEAHISDETFGVETFSQEIGISYTQLYRKLKSVCDLTTSGFILSVKMKKAQNLLLTSNKSISEICYEVGFSSPSYFTKCFKDQYGITPTEFCEKQNEGL
jgi:signal transduction histidine kinase/ligand-binding sensor domain-containing protein/CheY-like chemotaxis protein/AraC-like DNA-binding protein